MNDEIIFKKCDSKLTFNDNFDPVLDTDKLEEECEEVLDDTPNNDLDDQLEEVFDEAYTPNIDLDDQIENPRSPKDSFGSAGSIPNKFFSGSKNVLRIIGWINDKWTSSNALLPNISPESGIENQDEYLLGNIKLI